LVLSILTAALACYFLGNHNGAICVSLMMGDDVRTHGSGNAGLTNFIRSYGTGRAVLVILIDVLKAILACLLAGCMLAPYGYGLEGRMLGGVCVMLGHDFPALQGFRGGKGILSGWFVAFVIDWRIGLMIGIVFFVAYFLTKYVSLGSLLAAVTFGVGFILFYYDNLLVCLGGIFLSVLTVFMHRGNLVRLVRGEERKTDLFKRGSKK
jgi:glycerol-3-phosphate acyltransferase PlsY